MQDLERDGAIVLDVVGKEDRSHPAAPERTLYRVRAGELDNFMRFDGVMKDGALILDPPFAGGGGGFITNAGDLARWMALFAEGKAFPASLLPEVRRGVPAGQLDVGEDAQSGLGVEIVQTPLGVAYGHGGFFPGYVSLVLWYPERGIAIAMQVNSSAADAFTRPLRNVLHEAAEALVATPR